MAEPQSPPATPGPSLRDRVGNQLGPIRRPDIAVPTGRAQRVVIGTAGLVLALSWAQDIARGNPPKARPLVGAAFLAVTLSIAAEFAPDLAEMFALLVLVAVLVNVDVKVWTGLTGLFRDGVEQVDLGKGAGKIGKDTGKGAGTAPKDNAEDLGKGTGTVPKNSPLTPAVPTLRPVIR